MDTPDILDSNEAQRSLERKLSTSRASRSHSGLPREAQGRHDPSHGVTRRRTGFFRILQRLRFAAATHTDGTHENGLQIAHEGEFYANAATDNPSDAAVQP
jgi:hypothetical protein